MTMLETVRRLGKLGFYFGLGAVTAAFDACGDGSTSADAQDTPGETREDATAEDGDVPGEAEAGPDADADVADEADADADVELDAADGDADAAADVVDDVEDAGQDLWDMVFE
jgi:hypothetical protein